jgi:hypothetical protein
VVVAAVLATWQISARAVTVALVLLHCDTPTHMTD